MLLKQPIYLYKSFGTSNFNIICNQFQLVEEDLSFVHLLNVSFLIFPERKELSEDGSTRTVHAVAKGNLQRALPKLIQPSKSVMDYFETLPEVDYNPNGQNHFFLTKTGEAIFEAKELYAFNAKVRVVL